MAIRVSLCYTDKWLISIGTGTAVSSDHSYRRPLSRKRPRVAFTLKEAKVKLQCDHCHTKRLVRYPAPMPDGWVLLIEQEGGNGVYLACGDACSGAIVTKYVARVIPLVLGITIQPLEARLPQ